jgi:putative DNA methylase
MTTYRKKLIEVALPLDEINAACKREKSIRHGHPSTLHLWWARRPLAAARAVIFAQMVDDPSSIPGLSEEEILVERERLFEIIRKLVLWENTTNEEVLEEARAEIRKSWARTCAETGEDPNKLPAFHDPFAGGGALPLEAQRLGLESYASDLNPVAVLINKAMIEIPPKFAGKAPVNPKTNSELKLLAKPWRGAEGLAEDVRYYGEWMRDEAQKKIGHLYPKIEVTREMVAKRPDLAQYQGQKLTVIAWLWTRTVKSPNPAFSHVDVPLASTFMLSTKKGTEHYVQPVIDGDSYRFEVKAGLPEDLEAANAGTKLGRGANFKCLVSQTVIDPKHIYAEGQSGEMGARLMTIVAEGKRSRVYISPTEEMEAVASQAHPTWAPDVEMPKNPRWFSPPLYGLTTYGDLFTPRQLVALTTFSDLVGEARKRAEADAIKAGLPDDGVPLRDGGMGAKAYGEAVGVYVGFAQDKVMDRGSSLGRWDPTPTQSGIINTFSRQALPMSWDFAESCPLTTASGSYIGAVTLVAKAMKAHSCARHGLVFQEDASTQELSSNKVISTDPPYYDNIGYADLSDFFYVWLRRGLKDTFPKLFATVAVPKAEELVATPYRHGGKQAAETFFLDGMTQAMNRLALQANPHFPVTIYYAFKQSETGAGNSSSTGWETFLAAVIEAGFGLTGTWPMRTELANRMIGSGANALASSIVLVCRKRPEDAPIATRRDFLRDLRSALPAALANLQRSNLAPVDLAQSSIGPGMAVFSKYRKVIEADGSTMTVRSALQLINQVLDESLGAEEGQLDGDTRFAVTWFESYQYKQGPFGEADNLARARAVSVAGVAEAGVLQSDPGQVRLFTRPELPADWDPAEDKRLTVWEATQYLIKRLEEEGEQAAAALLKDLGPTVAEQARNLAYRLYTICERKKWAEEARAYNGLVLAWPELEKLAASDASTATTPSQVSLEL